MLGVETGGRFLGGGVFAWGPSSSQNSKKDKGADPVTSRLFMFMMMMTEVKG